MGDLAYRHQIYIQNCTNLFAATKASQPNGKTAGVYVARMMFVLLVSGATVRSQLLTAHALHLCASLPHLTYPNLPGSQPSGRNSA